MGKNVFPKKHLRKESVSWTAMKRICYLKCEHAPTLLEIAMMVERGLININTTDPPPPPAPLRRHMLHTDHKIPLSQVPGSSDFQIKSSSLRCGAHCGFAAWNSTYMRRFHLPLLSSCRAASEKATLAVCGNGGPQIVNTPMFSTLRLLKNAGVNKISLNTRELFRPDYPSLHSTPDLPPSLSRGPNLDLWHLHRLEHNKEFAVSAIQALSDICTE